MRRNATMLVVSALLVGSALQAGEVAYVEWSRADDDKRWGYAAFDGDEATAWCSGQDGVGDTLTLGFVGPRKVDEIGLIVGARRKGELDKSLSRVRELEVSDGRTKQVLSFKDKPELQSIKIKPALDSQRMTFTVSNLFPGEGRSSPVCIAEIVLRYRGAAFTGEPLRATIRGLSASRQPLLHLWIDQVGAPERYLTLGMDGSFLWVYEPILEGKRARLQGSYGVSGNKLWFKTGSGKTASMAFRVDRVADGDQVFEQLVLEGGGLHEAFAATYQVSGVR